MALEFPGIHALIHAASERLVDVEGALSSAKTTTCLAKEVFKSRDHPGIESFICRYSQTDTETKLQPAYEKIIASEIPSDKQPEWNKKEMAYIWPNGSKTFCYGVKSGDSLARYRKLRGLGVARIYVDQLEEWPHDVFLELTARMRQPGFEHQFTGSPNPVPYSHWIAKYEFPENKLKPGRRLFQLSIYDNPHLPPETVAGFEAAYPVGHGKRAGAILGKRGANIIGDPIYEGMFSAELHVKPVSYDPSRPLLEAFDYGKQQSCWVVAQRGLAGDLRFLGGIIGQDLFLEDFLPIVKSHRSQWFPDTAKWKTACGPSSNQSTLTGFRYTGLNILRESGFAPVYRDNSNAADVRLAMIECLGARMRRRIRSDMEALAVNNDSERWLRASREGAETCPFLAEAFASGYTWDEHLVSVGNKQVRQPSDDGWSEHGMRCAEFIELNFCIGHVEEPAEAPRTPPRRRLSPWG